jgi:PleD family two-component response regulator
MTTREKGTGLGLAIVRKIVEDHGGRLELHDAPSDFHGGVGAMIRIVLPAARADRRRDEPIASKNEKVKMASDILIVDDEEDIRELVSGILDDEGHETRTAHDSDSALAAIADRVPRLIFLDIWLQGSKLDGLALLDEIKKQHPDCRSS